MALGAYSVVRFADNLSDQRINLGVLVWHPLDGFRFRFTSAIGDRVRAIDPRILVAPIKTQLDTIQSEIAAAGAGRDDLDRLSRWFTTGVEVADPYPARIQSADETLDELYQKLVARVPEIFRASSQVQFENKVKRAVRDLGKRHHVKVEDLGSRKIGKLLVNVGVRATADRGRSLIRALSLQSLDRPDRQLATAKAAAMDINFVKRSGHYKDHTYYVTVQPPKPSAQAKLKDSLAWLEEEADHVLIVDDAGLLPQLLESAVLHQNGAGAASRASSTKR